MHFLSTKDPQGKGHGLWKSIFVIHEQELLNISMLCFCEGFYTSPGGEITGKKKMGCLWQVLQEVRNALQHIWLFTFTNEFVQPWLT